jgi:hypothetical protein
MDCKSARLLLEFARPGGGEVEAADAAALHQHLAECPECAALASDERRADEHLGRAVRDVPVPAGLRERVLKRLSVERDAWYRRWLVRWVAAAAVLLAAGWLGYHYWLGRRPALDGGIVHRHVNQRAFSASEVERAFREELGVDMKAPPGFHYHLLRWYGIANVQGRQVPELLFLSPRDPDNNNQPTLAKVYVLSGRQFNLEGTRSKGMAFGSGNYSVKLEDFGVPDYLYVVVYPGDSFNTFCPDPNPKAH